MNSANRSWKDVTVFQISFSPSVVFRRTRRRRAFSWRCHWPGRRALTLNRWDPQGADPRHLSYSVAKAGRNHLKEEISPLLPTGIGEWYSQTISNLGHGMWTPPINECVELTLVLDLICSATSFPLQDICAVYDIHSKAGTALGLKDQNILQGISLI
jgi:hypothetical protein